MDMIDSVKQLVVLTVLMLVVGTINEETNPDQLEGNYV